MHFCNRLQFVINSTLTQTNHHPSVISLLLGQDQPLRGGQYLSASSSSCASLPSLRISRQNFRQAQTDIRVNSSPSPASLLPHHFQQVLQFTHLHGTLQPFARAFSISISLIQQAAVCLLSLTHSASTPNFTHLQAPAPPSCGQPAIPGLHFETSLHFQIKTSPFACNLIAVSLLHRRGGATFDFGTSLHTILYSIALSRYLFSDNTFPPRIEPEPRVLSLCIRMRKCFAPTPYGRD